MIRLLQSTRPACFATNWRTGFDTTIGQACSPSVAGWPGGLAWLGGQELVARVNSVAWITESSQHGDGGQFDRLAQPYGRKSPESWLDALATLLLGLRPSSVERSVGECPSQSVLQSMRRLLSRPEAQVE
jgi:hypothetical protein